MNRLKQTLLLFACLLLPIAGIAQTNLQTIELYGKVTANGEGINKVAVTDGLNIVETNENGEYTMLTNGVAEFVYISIPSGYKVPMENNTPHFFQRIEDKAILKQEFNFELEKLSTNEDKHALVVWADPQVYFEDELPVVKKAAEDVVAHLNETMPNVPAYGIVAGDIVGSANAEPKFYDPMKQIIADTEIPFFYLPGNHDIRFWVPTDDRSKHIYKDSFGPTYYSFDRGQIHYVVLDDCFYNGNNFYYIGYLYERQLEWLSQDLARVPKGNTVLVSLHIPTYSHHAFKGEWSKEIPTEVLQNRGALYNMLEPFNAHIMSGHLHRNENYVINSKLYEHNHVAICALFYDADWCNDGTPRGYAVYEFDGADVKWHYKAVGESVDLQFKLYGVGESHEKPEAIVANVWNHDPAWKVYWYENDVKMGEMQQFFGTDTRIRDHVKANKQNFKHAWSSATPTEHMFFAEPKSANSDIKVEVIDRFGRSYFQEIKAETK